jgi:peptidoglycan hydrolase-like protein with peptidoglycan-binding domain
VTNAENFEGRTVDDKKPLPFRGHLLNAKTILMLQSAERRLKRRFLITQGSFNPGVNPSAHTHDLGGVLDIHPGPMTRRQVRALRKAGFAAWHRLPTDFKADDHVPEHIHAVSLFDTDLHSSADDQRTAYLQSPRRNGLANNLVDDGPKVRTPREPKLEKQTVRRREIVFGPRRNESVAFLQDVMGIFADGVFGKETRRATRARFGWDGAEPMDLHVFKELFPSSVFDRDPSVDPQQVVAAPVHAVPA